MKKETKDEYVKRMARHRPPPKKGKKRKDTQAIARESNAELVKERIALQRYAAALDGCVKIFALALIKATATTKNPKEFYVERAMDELRESGAIPDNFPSPTFNGVEGSQTQESTHEH